MKKSIALLLLGLIIAIIANWPSVIRAYFPINLPFCAIGGFLVGWYGIRLVAKVEK